MSAPHKPIEMTRRQVKIMAAHGVSEVNIAEAIGISAPTLRKYYRDQLNLGFAVANFRIARSLFRAATRDGPQSLAACIFWLRCRAGWQEGTDTPELGTRA